MAEFIPSEEQQAIFDAVIKTMDNIAIRALAGTGKTTTLVELARRIPKQGSRIFCAFNKEIVRELSSRLDGTGMTAQTFHSLGFGALKKHLGVKEMRVEPNKYRQLVYDWIDSGDPLRLDNNFGLEENSGGRELAVRVNNAIVETAQRINDPDVSEADLRRGAINLVVGLSNFARLKLADWHNEEELYEIAAHYDFSADVEYQQSIIAPCIAYVPMLLGIAEKMVREQAIIDFTDMIYWAVKWNVNMYQFDWVFVDESQDLSPMQRRMIEKIVRKRIVLVGDPYQAIYEFAGADSDSFDLSVATFQAKVLPLTVTRRCAQIVTQHAANLVSDFRCPPEKPRGKIVWIEEDQLAKVMKPGDMGLCRLKAPLIGAALDLIAAGVPATILGNDIGKALIAVIEKLQKIKGYTFASILSVLQGYEDRQVAKALAKRDEAKAEGMRDTCNAVRLLIEVLDAHSDEDLVNRISRLFADTSPGGCVTFATIHKCKGLEADRIFILNPGKLPLSFPGMRLESRQQETNLDYVARTRAKTTLVYLVNKDYRDKKPKPAYVQDTFEDLTWETQRLPEPEIIISKPEVLALPAGSSTLHKLASPIIPFGAFLGVDEPPMAPMINSRGIDIETGVITTFSEAIVKAEPTPLWVMDDKGVMHPGNGLHKTAPVLAVIEDGQGTLWQADSAPVEVDPLQALKQDTAALDAELADAAEKPEPPPFAQLPPLKPVKDIVALRENLIAKLEPLDVRSIEILIDALQIIKTRKQGVATPVLVEAETTQPLIGNGLA